MICVKLPDDLHNEKDKKEVEEWIEKVAGGDVVKPDSLKVRLIQACLFCPSKPTTMHRTWKLSLYPRHTL